MDPAHSHSSAINSSLFGTSKPPSIRYKAVAPPTLSSFDILSLLPELQHVVFDHLDPVTSTCLGLTCKSLYKIHQAHHCRVPLTLTCGPTRFDCLAMLLVEPMGPTLRYSGKSGIFVNLERWKEERIEFGLSRPLAGIFLNFINTMQASYDVLVAALPVQG